jgi:hypothetical protein
MPSCTTNCGSEAFVSSPGRWVRISLLGASICGLATGTRLYIGDSAILEVTGLRNPCAQLDKVQKGLMAATLDRDAAGNLVRKAGIMGIVLAAGEVRPGDAIHVEPSPPPHRPLAVVWVFRRPRMPPAARKSNSSDAPLERTLGKSIGGEYPARMMSRNSLGQRCRRRHRVKSCGFTRRSALRAHREGPSRLADRPCQNLR